jgi:hypothetical protein
MRLSDIHDAQVATGETRRGIHRRIVFTLICRQQPISRADRAHTSGLQSSEFSMRRTCGRGVVFLA